MKRVTRLVCAKDAKGKKREGVEPTESNPLAWCKERMGTKNSFSFAVAFAVLLSRQSGSVPGGNKDIYVKLLWVKKRTRGQ
jgi:hypothetical protein